MSDNHNNKAANEAKLIVLEPGKSFTANGKKYIVGSSYTIGRLDIASVLEEELMSMSYNRDSKATMRKALDHFNKGEIADAVVVLHNKINAGYVASKVGHIALRVCALFINREDEDARYITEEQIKDKINDWSVEGLDAAPFLAFVFVLYRQLMQSYETDITNILTQMTNIREIVSKEVLNGGKDLTAEK